MKFCFAILLFLSVGCSKKLDTTSSPNVIYILADDLGYGDLSCYGQEKIATPNIDRIANEGVKFTDHYSGNTVCSPSRAVLMTGQHPGNVHCRGNMPSENMGALDIAMVTLPRLFKNAGYATGAYGKWGMGITNEEGASNPMAHGFDHYTGWKSQMIAHTYYPSSIVRDGHEVALDSGTYIHDLIMDDAFAFIKNCVKSDKPFFCYLPTAIPHAAMHAPKNLHDKWRKEFPEFEDKIGRYGAGPGEVCPPVVNPIAGYAAMMEHLDNQVGELLEMLKVLGIDNNTIVMFASDNGSHLEGGHDPKFWNSNGEMRGHKRDLYEGGIRSPFMVRWPGVVSEGRESEHISGFQDILPTMADLTGQDTPEQNDGVSFLSTLKDKGAQAKHDYLYWEFRQGKEHYISGQAVRMGKWKGVLKQKRVKGENKATKMELYDLSLDLSEKNNIADQHPEIVEEMYNKIKEAHTPLPDFD